MKFIFLPRKVFVFLLLVSLPGIFTACYRYYKPVNVNLSSIDSTRATIKKLNDQDRYFILRTGTGNFALSNVEIDEARLILSANLSSVPPEHQLYIKSKKQLFKYKKRRQQEVVLKEVHLFTSDATKTDSLTRFELPLTQLQRVEVVEFDKRRTTVSYVSGSVVGAVALIAIIAAAIPSRTPEPPPSGSDSGSCPYISTFDGEGFALQGEIYSGAIYPSLQKDDYLPLRMQANNGSYLVKISNDLKEIQYTDFADLMVVEHDKGVQLLIDPQGKLHTVSKVQAPVTAMLNNRLDVRNELQSIDYKSCIFKDGSGSNNKEDLYLIFDNKQKKTKGKLVLSTRTSLWFNYVYNEFTKGFGGYYKKWVKDQEKKPASELEKWADEQHVPLTISVKNANGWKEVNKVKTIGPILNRSIVIPLDVLNGEKVEVKISGGYLFWELDYAAIDYSEDVKFSVKEIKPYKAINEKGINVLPELYLADKKFMVQANVGDSTILKYKSIEAQPGMAQSFFFHTSGYYDHPREHKGLPKVAFLKSFAQPGALSAFSKRKYYEASNRPLLAKK